MANLGCWQGSKEGVGSDILLASPVQWAAVLVKVVEGAIAGKLNNCDGYHKRRVSGSGIV